MSSPLVISTGTGGAGAAEAAAAAAELEPEPTPFDHEAATICATPMLLQFLLAFVLSWRTKFGGNLKIRDDRPLNDAVDAPMTRAAEILGLSNRADPEKSGSDRHSKDEHEEEKDKIF